MFCVEHFLPYFCMVFNDVTIQILKKSSRIKIVAFSFLLPRSPVRGYRGICYLHFHFCFTCNVKMEETIFPKHWCPATMLQFPIFQKILIQFFTAVNGHGQTD